MSAASGPGLYLSGAALARLSPLLAFSTAARAAHDDTTTSGPVLLRLECRKTTIVPNPLGAAASDTVSDVAIPATLSSSLVTGSALVRQGDTTVICAVQVTVLPAGSQPSLTVSVGISPVAAKRYRHSSAVLTVPLLPPAFEKLEPGHTTVASSMPSTSNSVFGISHRGEDRLGDDTAALCSFLVSNLQRSRLMRECIHHFLTKGTERLPLGITCDVVVCAADGAIVDAMVAAACTSIISTHIPRFVAVPRRGRGETGADWKAAVNLSDAAATAIGGTRLLTRDDEIPCLVATSFVHVSPSAQSSDARSFIVMDPTAFEEQLAVQKLSVINEVVIGPSTTAAPTASVFHWGGGALSDDIASICTQAAASRSAGMQDALSAAIAHSV